MAGITTLRTPVFPKAPAILAGLEDIAPMPMGNFTPANNTQRHLLTEFTVALASLAERAGPPASRGLAPPDPVRTRRLVDLANRLLLCGRAGEAAELFARLCTSGLLAAEVHTGLAGALEALGLPRLAARAYIRLGRELLERQRPEAAAAAFRKATTLDPVQAVVELDRIAAGFDSAWSLAWGQALAGCS